MVSFRSTEGTIGIDDFQRVLGLLYGPDWDDHQNPVAVATFNNFLEFNAKVKRPVGRCHQLAKLIIAMKRKGSALLCSSISRGRGLGG